MEVSESEAEPGGQELIQTVLELTGLPEDWVRKELDQILEQSGQSSGTITLDQLREAMAAYLEMLQLEHLESLDPTAPIVD